jgi:hypothetical protein
MFKGVLPGDQERTSRTIAESHVLPGNMTGSRREPYDDPGNGARPTSFTDTRLAVPTPYVISGR